MKVKIIQKKILADTITPISAYLRIRKVFEEAILLEANDFQEYENSRSFICAKPLAKFVVSKNTVTQEFAGKTEQVCLNKKSEVSDYLSAFMKKINIPSTSDFNGLYGYNSYRAVEYFEKIELQNASIDTEIPEIYYALYKYVIKFELLKNELCILENITESETESIDDLIAIINGDQKQETEFDLVGKEISDMTDEEYKNLVTFGKKHCLRGDVFQIVLSRRFEQKYIGDDFNVYRQLRSINPSPYLFYFDYGTFRLFGSSPETQIKIRNNKAYINPIAGTYPSSGDKEKDKKISEKLMTDDKEIAEHIMLVDLARNDLGRISKNVKVEKLKEIHFYSHVIHIVSEVSALIDKKADGIKVMASTFPAGTLTGAPKYKAMQLIDKYEKTDRSFYGGSIGFLGFNGDINQAIMIRSFMAKNNTLYYRAGAGIVANSIEINELNEVFHKIASLREAIKRAKFL